MSMLQAACCCGGAVNPCECGWPDSFTVAVTISGTYLGYGAVSGSGSIQVSFPICVEQPDPCIYESRHNGSFEVWNNTCTAVDTYGDVGQLLWQSAFVNTGGTTWQKVGIKLLGASVYYDGVGFTVALGTGIYDVYEDRSVSPYSTFELQSILYMCGATPCGPIGLSCCYGDDVGYTPSVCAHWKGPGSGTITGVLAQNGIPTSACDDPSGAYTGTDSNGITYTVTVS